MSLKVCMFVYNNCKHDSRVLKEAKTLAEAGYDVRIIAVLDKITEPYEERDGFKIIRVVKDPIHYKILRVTKNFTLITFIASLLKILGKIGLFPVRKFWNLLLLLFAKPKHRAAEDQSPIWTHHGLVTRLKQVFGGIDQRVKEIGFKGYIKETMEAYPAHFHFIGWTLLFSYYAYRYAKKALYWGVRRPARVIKAAFYARLRDFLMVFHKPLCFLDYYYRSFQLVRQEPADIYHAHDLNTLPVAYLAKCLTGGKVIYDSHELYTETSTISNFERKIARHVEKYLICRADKVITVNQSIATELSKRYKVQPPVVIMNCPIINNKTCNLGHNLLQSKLGLNNETPIILYQGGYSPNRGLQNLILSAHYVHKGIFVFMGWGKLEQELKDLVTAEGLNDRVKFVDPVPQEVLLDYTRSAHLGVIPYQFVGLNNYYCTPNKLFEYIAAGLPVVGSNFPELKRIIEGYKLGKTFDPENPKDIADAINYVLSDPNRYQQMKKNALEAAKIFNWENESKRLLAIYKALEDDQDG